MNPTDLRGPQFLLFYLVLGAVVLAVMILRRRMMEPGGAPREKLTDPYEIAFLRGGWREVVKVAVVSLIERKLLIATGSSLTAPTDRPPKADLAPVEVSILRKFLAPSTAVSAFRDGRLEGACGGIRTALERKGFLPNATQRAARWASAWVAVLLLAGLAGYKIAIALGRGKSNVWFLVVLAVAFTITLLVKASPRRTPRGDRAIRDMQRLFRRLREGPPPQPTGAPSGEALGYGHSDLLMLGALYGVASLPPATQLAYSQGLWPKSTAFGGSSGCGSGCGSSGCGSGGDGGGGGCGGGCGGCGGD